MTDAQDTGISSQRVADLVAERILSGRLKPGTRITQDELAAELNVSRIPVRDALRTLEARGLVELRHNAGARVSTMTARDMEISYKVREAIEPMLLAESIPNLTDLDIEEMRDTLAQLIEARDIDAYMPLDRHFHWVSYRGHNAPALAQIVARLWDTTQSYRRAYAKLAIRNGARILRTEHELLFGAVERREIETAQATLLMHIRRTRVGLTNYAHLLEAEPVVRSDTYY